MTSLNGYEPATSTVVIGPHFGSLRATFNRIFVENVFGNRIWGSVVPRRIVIEIKLDSRDRSPANVGATPTACGSQEFQTNLKI